MMSVNAFRSVMEIDTFGTFHVILILLSSVVKQLLLNGCQKMEVLLLI